MASTTPKNKRAESDQGAFTPPCVILAGGRSKRMSGQDKCLLPLGGKPILAHLIDRLKPQVSALILNANGDPARFRDFAIDIVPDAMEGFLGPLAGICAAFDWFATHNIQSSWALVVSGDTPFVPRNLAPTLFAHVQQNPEAKLIVPRTGGQEHYLCALWRSDQAEALRQAVQDGSARSVKQWVSNEASISVDFDTGPIDPFLNINTQEDYLRAETVLERDTP